MKKSSFQFVWFCNSNFVGGLRAFREGPGPPWPPVATPMVCMWSGLIVDGLRSSTRACQLILVSSTGAPWSFCGEIYITLATVRHSCHLCYSFSALISCRHIPGILRSSSPPEVSLIHFPPSLSASTLWARPWRHPLRAISRPTGFGYPCARRWVWRLL